jgi:hypothetical protein
VLLVSGFTPIPADPWWKESPTIQRMMPLVEWGAGFLPSGAIEHLDFEPDKGDQGEPKGEPESPDKKT